MSNKVYIIQFLVEVLIESYLESIVIILDNNWL